MKTKSRFTAALLAAFAIVAAAACTDSKTDGPDQPTVCPEGTFPDFSEVAIGNGESHTFTVNSGVDFYISISDSADRNKSALNFTMTEQGVNSTSITKDERRCSAGVHTFVVTADAASYDEVPSCTVWMRVGDLTEKIRTITIDQLDRTTTIYTATLNDDGYWATDGSDEYDSSILFTPLGAGQPVVMQFNRFSGHNTFMASIKVETNVDEWSFADTPAWLTTSVNGDICTFGIDTSKLTAEQLRNGIADATFTLQDISTGHAQAALGTYGIVLPAAADIAYAYFGAYLGKGSRERLTFTAAGRYNTENNTADAAAGIAVGLDTRIAVVAGDNSSLSDGDFTVTASAPAQNNRFAAPFTLAARPNDGYNRTAYVLAFAGSVPADVESVDVTEKYADNIVAMITQAGALGRADGWRIEPYDEYDALDAGARFERLDEDSDFVQSIRRYTDEKGQTPYGSSDVQIFRLTYKQLRDTRYDYAMPVAYAARFRAGSSNAQIDNSTLNNKLNAALNLATEPLEFARDTDNYFYIDFASHSYDRRTEGGMAIITEAGQPIVIINLVLDPNATF